MHARTFRLAAAAAGVLVLAGAAILEADIDWRSKGAVTPVKNQGTTSFDASWAFAVTGAVEGYRAINSGSLTSLSEQQLIDCVPAVGDCADPLCGQAPCGLNFAMTNGLASESAYPYTGLQGTCKVPTPVATIPGWTRLVGETGIAGALSSGPVIARLSIGDHGTPIAAWTSYAGGPFPASAASAYDDTVHQWVLIVGYSSSLYTIKNSIGTSWGSSGYLFLPRGFNALGVGDDAYAPSIDTAHGACALPGGACQDMTAADCTTAGGIYGGDLSFCPASCGTCADDATPPVIRASAIPRPAKKGSGTLTLTVAGTATDDCTLDRSSGEYWVTDSYRPGGSDRPESGDVWRGRLVQLPRVARRDAHRQARTRLQDFRERPGCRGEHSDDHHRRSHHLSARRVRFALGDSRLRQPDSRFAPRRLGERVLSQDSLRFSARRARGLCYTRVASGKRESCPAPPAILASAPLAPPLSGFRSGARPRPAKLADLG